MALLRIEPVKDPASGRYYIEIYNPPDATAPFVTTEPRYMTARRPRTTWWRSSPPAPTARPASDGHRPRAPPCANVSPESLESVMLTHEENELLCRVEGEAPMGQLMRRHWLPACMIEEVAEADGTPVQACACSARTSSRSATPTGASACSASTARIAAPRCVFGRNEECGLRCLYHGWKMDVEGNVVEMASEPRREPHDRRR